MSRTALAAVLVLLLVPVLVTAQASVWAARTVLDAATFATVVERSLESPAVELALADSIATTVVDALGRRAPAELDDLATGVLGLPPGSDRSTVKTGLSDRIVAALHTSAVRSVRRDVVASIHEALVGSVTTGNGALRRVGADIVLDTGVLVERVAADTDPRIVPLLADAGLDPGHGVVVARADELRAAEGALALMDVLRVILPLLAVSLALLVVVLAHRRVRALGIVGLAAALAGLLSIAAVWLVGRSLTGATDLAVTRRIIGAVYDAITSPLLTQATVLVVAGLVVWAVAWVLERRGRRHAVARMLGPRERSGV